ncbi:MAG TPA: thiazole synthase, partial [Turneriella sp.]|nr:thiazole synthase [Turneriella sp.]
MVGTGRYPDLLTMQRCHEVAETQMVTVALRRIDLTAAKTPQGKSTAIIDYIDRKKITLLPNTAGVSFAADALRYARIAAAMDCTHLKVEVTGDLTTLLPDPIETLKAVELMRGHEDTRSLYLMVYTNDDPVLARRLADAGADCIMPAASPIGSGRGIANEANLI